MRYSTLLVAFYALVVEVAIAVDPVVDLTYSQYCGTAQSNGITSWLGMRFAAPPLGDLRWREPQDPLPTEGIQAATSDGLICLSTPPATTPNTTSEDCLFLDVFAPSNATTSSKLPVYFWIQGGGFNVNSNANYKGDGLIQAAGMNIVVVTFNYRVGLYGFLSSNEVVLDGDINVGLLDQRKAMAWVQKYISQFGGDPTHVTIGGASAGGGSVSFHLTAYGGRNDGLFHAAAAESATSFTTLTIAESQYQYDNFTQRVGCSTAADSLACLRALNVTYLQANNYMIPYPNLGASASAPLFMYGPTIDGALIQDYPDRMFSQGRFIQVPVIYGDDTNGGTDFVPITTASYAQMDQFLLDNFPAMTPEDLLVLNAIYPESDQFNGTGAYWRTGSNAYGEIAYLCPGMAVSSAYDTYSTLGSWNYWYDVEDPTQMAEGYGVPHTAEINAIWGPDNVTPGAAPASYYTTNAAIIPVIQGYWTSFIRSYNPNTYRAAGSPEWEEWTAAGQNRLMLMTNMTSMVTVAQDMQARCAYFNTTGLNWQQ